MTAPELDYEALVIDTCIFEAHGLRLGRGFLKQLEQFADGPVSLVFPDIVHGELTAHIKRRIESIRTKIDSSLEDVDQFDMSTPTDRERAKALVYGEGSSGEIAKRVLTRFYESTGAFTIESAKYSDSGTLVDMYFSGKAPFGTTAKRKHEFPDAIALVTLEEWARTSEIQLLAVSSDGGWKEFGESSELIDVVGDLGEAISRFQPHNAAKRVIGDLVRAIKEERPIAVLAAIEGAIRESLEDADIYIEADSMFYYEEDEIYAEYVRHGFIEYPTGNPEVSVVRVDSSILVIRLVAEVGCDVHCSLSLSMRDPIDKDYVSVGSTRFTAERSYQTDVLVSLAGDFSADLDGLDLVGVEVLDKIGYVDLGTIEPEWGFEG